VSARALTRGALLALWLTGCAGAASEGGDDAREQSTGGQGLAPSAKCPVKEPEQDASCDDKGMMCAYEACGRANASMWGCESRGWNQIFIPGCKPPPSTCPPELPEPMSACGEHRTCQYTRPCCDREVSVQADCRDGRWTVLDEDPDACPPCRTVQDGAACKLPPSCESLTCYSSSCYAAPKISRCLADTWQVEDHCKK
jgi:hypothetical protein